MNQDENSLAQAPSGKPKKLETYADHKSYLEWAANAVETLEMEQLEEVTRQFMASKRFCEDEIAKIKEGLKGVFDDEPQPQNLANDFDLNGASSDSDLMF